MLAGLETCLQGLPGYRIVRLADTSAQSAKQLEAYKPCAIIFDQNDQRLHDWNTVAELLKDNARALVIGLDTDSDNLIVLSNQVHGASHLDTVIAAIRAASHSS
jgi:DNA-binding NarL/FixJ family response regulator